MPSQEASDVLDGGNGTGAKIASLVVALRLAADFIPLCLLNARGDAAIG